MASVVNVVKLQRLLKASAAAAVFAAVSSGALAGGFAVREQSTEFQGMSFAGSAAAGGGMSGMYWNSAIVAFAPAGLYTELHGAGVLPNSSMNGNLFAGAFNLGLPTDSGEVGRKAIVPSGYLTYRLTRDLALGVGLNAPFGFRTEPTNSFWAGQTFANESRIKTQNINPVLAYRLTPWLAIGAGLQIQMIEGRLNSDSGIAPTSRELGIEGKDTSFGWTAGVNLTPMAGTNIGFGFRSGIYSELKGHMAIVGSPVPPAASGVDIVAATTLPEIATFSIRQNITPDLAVLGTVEWTNWSRQEQLDIICHRTNPNPVYCPKGNGQLVRSLMLNWHDGWFYALGLEYKASNALTLRGGGAYEKSPIQNATERTLRVADADRIWASVGATYKFSESIAFDLAYTHIWVEDAPIDRTESGVRFIGNSNSSVDIVSGSLKIKLGDPLGGK